MTALTWRARELGEKRGADKTWTKRSQSKFGAAVFRAQCRSKSNETEFSCRIGCAFAQRNETKHAADINDMRFVLRSEYRQQFVHQLYRGKQVDRHDGLPLRGRHLMGRPIISEARIVDEDVDLTLRCGNEVGDRGGDFIVARQIAVPSGYGDESLGFTRRLRQVLIIDVQKEEVGAFSRQRQRNGAADPGCGSGDQCGPSLDDFHLGMIVRDANLWLYDVR